MRAFSGFVALALALACSSNGDPQSQRAPIELAASPQAAARIDAVRQVFPGAVGSSKAAFRLRADRLVPRGEAWGSYAQAADGGFELFDEPSGVRATVELEGARSVPAQAAEGLLVYPAALGGGTTLMHRPLGTGTRDYLVLNAPPQRSEIAYRVTLGERVAGMRLIGSTLELLDESGAPRLRMADPAVFGADGARAPVATHVEGCAVDRSTAQPWGRAVTDPGARRCRIVVTWSGALRAPILFDPQWTLTGDLATARFAHESVSLADGKVLVVGGCPAAGCTAPLSSSEIYDPGSGTWAATGSFSTGRWRMGLALATNTPETYVMAGGMTSPTSGQKLDSQKYDVASGTWSAGNDMSHRRGGLSLTRMPDGSVLAVGGTYNTESIVTVEAYEPLTGTWTLKTGRLAAGRAQHTATALNDGSLLVVGGDTNRTTAERYVPWTDSFDTPLDLAHIRAKHRAVKLDDGRVLIVAGGGGGDGQFYWDDSEIYDPTSNTLTPVSTTLSSVRRDPVVAKLADGRVLAAGGRTQLSTNTASADVFDPATDSWTAVDDMNAVRTRATANLLPDGSVLVAGGAEAANTVYTNVKSSAELFVLAGDGSPCTVSGTCASGFCVDAVCCDTACDGVCESCSATFKGGGSDGQCGPTVAGIDPGSDCTYTPPSACGTDGQCDGAGACRYWPQGTDCGGGSAVCSGDSVTGDLCDGAGNCVTATSLVCEPYSCQSAACTTSCSGNADCAVGASCDTSVSECVAGTGGAGDSAGNGGTAGAGGTAGGSGTGGSGGAAASGGAGGTTSGGAGGTTSGGGSAGTTSGGSGGAGGSTGTGATGGGAGTGGSTSTGGTGGDAGAGGSTSMGGSAGATGSHSIGDPCGEAADCDSGFCVDGVCCDAACNSACMGCSTAAKGGGAEGRCEPVAAGLDPHGDCSTSGADCGADGACNGAGACRQFAVRGTQCGATTCVAGRVSGQLCDGAGTCLALENVSCAPFQCDAEACASSCAGSGDCLQPAACIDSVCVGRKRLGEACVAGGECESTLCVDGVCCNGVCNGQCEACDVVGSLGQCQPVTGVPHGSRAACKGSGVCAGSCDGANPSACEYTTASCGQGQTCQQGECMQTDRVCSSDGTASLDPSGVEVSCGAFRCEQSSGECRQSCEQTAHCADGYVCDTARCVKTSAVEQGDDAGCGCRSTGAPVGRTAWLGAALLALVAGRRRRRKLR